MSYDCAYNYQPPFKVTSHVICFIYILYIYHINTMIHKYNNIRDLYDLYIYDDLCMIWLYLISPEVAMVGVAPQRAVPVHQLGAQHCDVPRCLSRRAAFFRCDRSLWCPLLRHDIFLLDLKRWFTGSLQILQKNNESIITKKYIYREYERKHLKPVKRSTARLQHPG